MGQDLIDKKTKASGGGKVCPRSPRGDKSWDQNAPDVFIDDGEISP